MEILGALPSTARILIKSSVPGEFFRQGLPRDFACFAQSFDAGPAMDDSGAIDCARTLAEAEAMARRNAGRLDAEAEFLRRAGVSIVASDSASFPLAAAARAGLPSAAVANFTWLEIFAPYAKDSPRHAALLRQMRREYEQASLAIVPGLDVPMPAFRRQWRAPIVARQGRSIRSALARSLKLDTRLPWLLFYPGNLGFPFDWQALRAARALFLVFAPPPRPVENVISLAGVRVRHQDVVASVDGAIAKPGYGIVGECLACRTPLLYIERERFAEYDAMDRALQSWGGAIRAAPGDFLSGEWLRKLERLLRLRPARPAGLDGASAIAAKLTAMALTAC